MRFWQSDALFFDTCNLDHASCQHKMRLLTMMSLSNDNNELTFELLQQQLELKVDEIEAFIVDGRLLDVGC